MEATPWKTNAWKEIDKILFFDWDPIGVNDHPDKSRGEYSNYIIGVYRLLELKADKEMIAGHLCDVAKEHMGLELTEEDCQKAVDKLLAVNIDDR